MVSRFPGGASAAALSSVLVLLGLHFPGTQAARAQEARTTVRQPVGQVVFDTALYSDLDYRMIGPYRGGRAQAVAGHRERPYTFYMGVTGGGVWKTTNAGQDWRPVTDGYLRAGSIGSIDVADSDPSVVYVGTGELDIRGNASAGRGVYRSTDAGDSWSFLGLADAGQIGDVAVHPRNPDRVYAAALGHAFGPNERRGVFRSTDGGESWEKVLFLNDSTGVADLALNPRRPNEIYAGTWSVEREPWALRSGTSWEAGGGIWKSTDGGDTWEHLEGGLPAGQVGKVGVTVSRADPDRVWAIVEAPRPEGAVYRSDDAGKTWKKVGTDPRLQQRPFYYHHVKAHPTDRNTVYTIGEDFWVSHDGGHGWERVPTPHGDNHRLWINPERPEVMVEANDGGANVTLDGGETWSTQRNQPTAQFYRVEVDDRFPYRVYGAQQDNSTISVPAWTEGGVDPKQFWYSAGGCESGHIAVHPENPELIYAGCYHGEVTRTNRRTGRRVEVIPYAQAQEGQAAKELKYRFQWNAPIEIDPFDHEVVYHTSQVVHVTRDGGETWEVVSPDLTYDDTAKQGFPEPTVTRDLTGVEVYNTIFALSPSPHEEGVIWAGTDDGRVWLTRSRGGDADAWTEVTPEGLPRWSTVNAIEVSPHDPAKAVVTAYRYRLDDFAPYVYRTEDYGRSWTRIADGSTGIPADHPTRVVREDPEREGLLYAGTEFGMYVRFDDGARWQSLQLDLPTVPITDLKVHRGDLVVATQGRSFWILDDLSPLRQLDRDVAGRAAASGGAHLFDPRPAHRLWAAGGARGDGAPASPPRGAVLDYVLGPSPGTPIRLEVRDAEGKLIRAFTSDSGRAAASAGDGNPLSSNPLPAGPGMHRVTWDLRTPGVAATEDAAIWGPLHGVRVPPGTYEVRLLAGEDTLARELEVRKDPRLEGRVRDADLRKQYRLATAVRDTMSRAFEAVQRARSAREQVRSVEDRLQASPSPTDGSAGGAAALADSLVRGLTAVEEALLQTKNRIRADQIAHSPRLIGELSRLYGYVAGSERYSFVTGLDARPTEGAHRRFADLNAAWAEEREKLRGLLEEELSRLNRRLRSRNVPPVLSPPSSRSPARRWRREGGPGSPGPGARGQR